MILFCYIFNTSAINFFYIMYMRVGLYLAVKAMNNDCGWKVFKIKRIIDN